MGWKPLPTEVAAPIGKPTRAASLPAEQHKNLMDAVNTVKIEAAKAKPDKSLIERTLSLVQMAAASVSGIASAVTAVKKLMGLFLII